MAELEVNNYEVYVLESRGWRIQSRYPGSERELAMREARELEIMLERPVKIVRETYYPRRNASEESIAYITKNMTPEQARIASGKGSSPSATKKKVPRRGANAMPKELEQYANPNAGGKRRGAGGRGRKRQRAAAAQGGSMVGRVVGVTTSSLAIAGVMTGLAVMLLGKIPIAGLHPGTEAYSQALFGTFIVTFLFSAVPMLMTMVPWDELNGQTEDSTDDQTPSTGFFARLLKSKEDEEEERGRTVAGLFQTEPEAAQKGKGAEKDAAGGKGNKNADDKADPSKQDTTEADEAAARAAKALAGRDKSDEEEEDEENAADAVANESADGTDGETRKKKKKKKKKSEEEDDEANSLDDFPDEEPEIDPLELEPDPADASDTDPEGDAGNDEDMRFEQARLRLMKFLGGTVSALKDIKPQLDAYNKFGVNLIIAGASEALCEAEGLDEEYRDRMMRETVEVVGTKPDLAKSFVGKFEEYVMEPRYLQMVQTGRDAMDKFTKGRSNAWTGLAEAIDGWNRPQPKAQSGIMTILFTDIVGSTAMNQERGDDVAQEVVRVHNSVVRTALSQHGGREVKHTGDGIMASFHNASSAVDACIDMQKNLRGHNERQPDLELHIRIGINAGEPIQEENDFFGTTVQLAARVCAQAGTDEIFVSNVVRELCSGRPFNFENKGQFTMKGVREPQTLYDVKWQANGAPDQSGQQKEATET